MVANANHMKVLRCENAGRSNWIAIHQLAPQRQRPSTPFRPAITNVSERQP
jgi:hypothetical protein